MKPLRYGFYKHRKGGLYIIVHNNVICRDTKKSYVLYQSTGVYLSPNVNTSPLRNNTKKNQCTWLRLAEDFNDKFEFLCHSELIPILNGPDEVHTNPHKILKSNPSEVYCYANEIETMDLCAVYIDNGTVDFVRE